VAGDRANNVIIRDAYGKLIAVVEVVEVRGQKARIGFAADRSIKINRRVVDEQLYGPIPEEPNV
jgi:sRNA-binding carbon storage regulator CsrA